MKQGTLSPAPGSSRRELVVLVHGLGCNPLFMRSLAGNLHLAGYATCCWGYASLRGSVEQHARRFRAQLDELAGQSEVIHFVAHSLGSIVTRLALCQRPLPQAGRVVLIAPPNRGSPVAGAFAPLLGRVCPAIGELSDRQNSFVNRMAVSEGLHVGVIAARFDLLVPGASTAIAGQADHIVLSATHTSLLFQPSTAHQVREFLATGVFDHPPAKMADVLALRPQEGGPAVRQ